MADIEFVIGQEHHTSSWGKFYVKGLEKWEVKEDFPENIRDKHHSYQGYVALNAPDNTVFTVFAQSGDKRGTDDWHFYICVIDGNIDSQKISGYAYCEGKFKIVAQGDGKVKAPRLMDWWTNRATAMAHLKGEDGLLPKGTSLKFAQYCAEFITKRGIKELPHFQPK